MFAATLGSAMADKPQIAVVDIQRLFNEYFRTEEAQLQFNKDYAGIQKRVNQKIETVNEMILELKEIDKKLKNENVDERKQKLAKEFQLIEQERQMLINEMRREEKNEKEDVDRRKAASMQGIMSEIRSKVISFSKKGNYDFVFDQSGKNTNQVSFFLYLKDATDITEVLLKELNKFASEAPVQE
jgi:outer membrane protein